MPLPKALPAPFAGPIRIPHAAPFRLVDRIVSVDLAGGCLVAERRLTCNDALWPAESQPPLQFFSTAAAPAAAPVFPPTLLIEALCQAAACLNSLTLMPVNSDSNPSSNSKSQAPAAQQHHGYLVAMTDMKFPAFAYVGETITLTVEQKERRGQVIAFAVHATAAPPIAATPAALPHAIQPREIASGRLLFAVTLT